MSFSSRIKEELSRHMSAARHCQIAEIAAILSLCGRIQISGDPYRKCDGCKKVLYIIEKNI